LTRHAGCHLGLSNEIAAVVISWVLTTQPMSFLPTSLELAGIIIRSGPTSFYDTGHAKFSGANCI
jgi:hypothetical protein